MGKTWVRIWPSLALVLTLASAAQAQTRPARQQARPARSTPHLEAKARLLAKQRGFVRRYASKWMPATRLKGMPPTGGMRTKALRKARLMSFYIPETRNGVAGFRVERLYGMSDVEAPESVELGPDGKAKVEAAYATAVSRMVDQHITEPRADRLHWRAIRDLEQATDATDPLATGRQGIAAAVGGFDKWTKYLDPEAHRARQARFSRPTSESVGTSYTRDGLAVVRLSSFTTGTAEKIGKDLGRRRPRGIVLDLRGNGGGMTIESRKLLEMFAPDNRILTRRTTRDNGRVEPIQWRASTPGPYAGIPLFVLVDGDSASASETVTSSLKDNGLARIGGVRSFGKGVGQTNTHLDDGGSVWVTQTTIQGPTTRYHGTGIDVDVSDVDLETRGRAAAARRPADSAAGGDLVILGALEELRSASPLRVARP